MEKSCYNFFVSFRRNIFNSATASSASCLLVNGTVGEKLQQANEFKYLRSTVYNDVRSQGNVKKEPIRVKQPFENVKTCLEEMSVETSGKGCLVVT